MLTGFDLLNKVENMRTRGYTNKDIVVYCGYDRPGRTPQYTMFYENLLKVKAYNAAMAVREVERNNWSNFRQKAVCDAMFHSEEYNKNNDKVTTNQYHTAKVTSYFFCDEMLVNLVYGKGPVYAILYLPAKKSKTAKSRINAILRRTFGYSLFQKKGEWYIARPFHNDEVYTNGLRIEYPEI
jgi:hypothetical protein